MDNKTDQSTKDNNKDDTKKAGTANTANLNGAPPKNGDKPATS